MNDLRNILDAPAKNYATSDLKPDYTMASSLDYGINIFLLAVSGLAGLTAISDIGYALFLMLAWNLVLGSYQLVSALVGAVRGNYKKGYYLAGAIIYLIMLFVGTDTMSFASEKEYEFIIGGVFFIGLPLIGAVYYTTLCLEAKNRGRQI